MPILPLTRNRADDQAPPASTGKSVHYERVKTAIPAWLLKTSVRRVEALKTITLAMPDWYRNASANTHRPLKNTIKLAWNAQNGVDKALTNLQDLQAFAKPLLQQALKDRFDVDEDVEQIWLRLYAPADTSWWVHDFASGTQSRTVSLLDAALHNFSSGETFTTDSEFITRPDARGHFAIKHLKHKISIEQYKSLCRELNIGARYAQHLKEFLLSPDRVVSNVLRHKVVLSQKSALSVAAHMALMKKDLSQDAYDVVQGILEDRAQLKWNGQPVGYYNLVMMDARLSGIIVIAAGTFSSGVPVPLIVYVPHDPEHPLKQYPSSLEFMDELTRQLRDTQSATRYQQFFSQFVAHQQRGHFFAGLNDRLSKVKWQHTTPGSGLPNWREAPLDNPNLQFHLENFHESREMLFSGDLWGYLYRQTLNKILNDAREIAISTEYADRMARWSWWDNLEKLLSDMLNIALLVVTPLVPGLGELMLVYTALQLTEEVVEGVVDLAEDRLAEAGEQVLGVLESVVQLAAFTAGSTLGNAARAKLSPFFERLKPVQLVNGQTRLWNPDLSPYHQSYTLPGEAKPDRLGIYQHREKQLLPLNGQLFELKQDPLTGQHRILHPERPRAYAPMLRHNAHGAWVCETENPRLWEGSTLMRRLGHTTKGFSDAQLERVRQISGTEDAALRRMHLENSPPPPLLTDTLQRLGLDDATSAPRSAEIMLLFSDFPELPESIAEKIMAGATASEHQQIARHNRLPLRLKSQARELQFETQTVRAAQGLYHDSSNSIDTERLILGTLRINSDTFGDLRIEIRQIAFDGDLRCAAGREDAPRVRVLIRDESGKYQVRDESNQPVHGADNLLEALLNATEHHGQNTLGYKPGDAEFFRQWLIAKSAPPRERRKILAAPPIRAVARHENTFLVRGACTSRGGETLHQRIQDLHSDFSDDEVDAFAEALIAKGQPLNAIEQRESDLDELRVILNRWEFQHTNTWGPGSLEFRDGGGQHIAERLIDCFERKKTGLTGRMNPDSYALDLSREMSSLDLQVWWSKRPPELNRFLEKIMVLKLDKVRFSSEANGLLKDFRYLRELSARGCELTGLPKSVAAMHRLERLQLSDNTIVLDASAVVDLKNLTYLEILRLEGNPLACSPDIGRMQRLKVVALKNTGLTTWPEGTLSKTRPRGFLLDMRGNPVDLIPEVVPGSPQAWVIARTRLDVDRLSELNLVRYQEIRRSLGLPPESATHADSGINLNFGLVSPESWTDVPGWGVERVSQWSELTDDPLSYEFIRVLIEIPNSADYQRGGSARRQLVQRVVRMLDAVYLDTQLREKLYTMAIAPVDCADAGAQLFNSMGINVLASEAYSYSTDPAQLQIKLVTLAKGAARLDLVNEIARADVTSRQGNPDDVEVYLAYQTGLADRLELPWQSQGMLYRPVSGVSDSMIDQAYETVLTLSEGDGLVNKMLEQNFWETYLSETYPIQIEANKQLQLDKYEMLETLRATQREWLESTRLPEARRTELRDRLKELMNDLPVPATVVFADAPISDATFDRLLVDLGDEEKELSRRLTRTALRQARQ
ncbi:dermonecrotic toxin domain-containing protein [Pseudomonas sp. McL0111]|uniref:dermonecrotic toxin domain-containing protein n=1 Tax=Pseudomonas sp. McL0111 TaxID=3457357 RepID=UPI00403E670A